MPQLASLLICVCLLSGARVAAAPAEPTGQAAPPLTASFETVSTETVSTRHGTKAQPARERWTLSREAGRVTYSFGQAAVRRFEVWQRTATQTRLLRVFPRERTSVEYTQGQLRALGDNRSWQQLTSLLPKTPAQLGLKPTGTGTFQQLPTQRFEGELGGDRVFVEWLPAQQLPAQLTIKNARLERSVRLRKLVVGQPAPEADAQAKGFRRIDAADLGDLEHDPFVKRYHALLQTPRSPAGQPDQH